MGPIICCVMLVRPPKELHYKLVREFYANAYSTYEHHSIIQQREGGKVVRFDRGAINVNMENPYANPTDKLCAYSKQANKRKMEH